MRQFGCDNFKAGTAFDWFWRQIDYLPDYREYENQYQQHADTFMNCWQSVTKPVKVAEIDHVPAQTKQTEYGQGYYPVQYNSYKPKTIDCIKHPATGLLLILRATQICDTGQ